MNQLHLLTGNIDQLIVLRMQRANRQETVLGELRQNHQPLAVRIAGFGQRGMVVAGLIMHIQFLADVVGFLTVVILDSVRNVPLAYLTVDKQRGVGVATTIKGGVQRSKPQFRLSHDGITQLDLVIKHIVQLVDLDYGAGG